MAVKDFTDPIVWDALRYDASIDLDIPRLDDGSPAHALTPNCVCKIGRRAGYDAYALCF